MLVTYVHSKISILTESFLTFVTVSQEPSYIGEEEEYTGILAYKKFIVIMKFGERYKILKEKWGNSKRIMLRL